MAKLDASRSRLKSVGYHTLDVGPRAQIKLPQQKKPATTRGLSGEDSVPYLYYLRESDEDRFSAITASMRAAFPSFDSLGFPPVAAGMPAMTYIQEFNHPSSTIPKMRKPRCENGSALSRDFIRMQHNMTSRLGFCPIGQRFNSWRGITS